jgi:hypothetical protein
MPLEPTPFTQGPLCTCGHPDGEHFAGFSYCKVCGPATCPRFVSAVLPAEPPDDAERWEMVAEFSMVPRELHATLADAIAVRWYLLRHPPQTEAEILDAVTTFSSIKHRTARLRQLLDDLEETRQLRNRPLLLATLLAGQRPLLDWLDANGRIRQGQKSRTAWDAWMNALRLHLYQGLALVPGNALAVAMVQVLRLLDDQAQYPQFARDEPLSPQEAQALPRNPYQAFADDMRADLQRFHLGPLVENDVLRYMGFVPPEP